MSVARSLKDSIPSTKAKGPLVIVRELIAEGKTGLLASGIYEGAVQKPAGKSASGKPFPASVEYKIRDMSTDTLYILNDTKALRDQLGQLAADGSDNVKVSVFYNGKISTKSGNTFHDFNVMVD